jgi:hypothetical protein
VCDKRDGLGGWICYYGKEGEGKGGVPWVGVGGGGGKIFYYKGILGTRSALSPVFSEETITRLQCDNGPHASSAITVYYRTIAITKRSDNRLFCLVLKCYAITQNVTQLCRYNL